MRLIFTQQILVNLLLKEFFLFIKVCVNKHIKLLSSNFVDYSITEAFSEPLASSSRLLYYFHLTARIVSLKSISEMITEGEKLQTRTL